MKLILDIDIGTVQTNVTFLLYLKKNYGNCNGDFKKCKTFRKAHTFFSGSVHRVFCLSLFLILHISEVGQMQKLFSVFHFGGIPPMKLVYF